MMKTPKPKKAKASAELKNILKSQGPMLSSQVARNFESTGTKADAARQRTSRLPLDTAALKGISFPKGARFIYHKDDIGTYRYFEALRKTIRENSQPLTSALNAINARDGVMSMQQFMISSGCPILQKKQLSAERVLAQLESTGLVRKHDIEGMGKIIVAGNTGLDQKLIKTMRARMMAEEFLLDAIASWLGRMNMVSPKVVEIRGDKNPRFSAFEFDLCGPSYLSPITNSKNGKKIPGFMVADVILGKELSKDDVFPFLRKCTLLNNIRGRLPYLPMLIGDSFSVDALRGCRAMGIITTRPETLFGRDVAMSIGSLLEVLSSVALAPADRLQNIFRKLSSVEGAAGNLRGALFEMITSHLVGELECGETHIGVLLIDSTNGKQAEADVVLKKQKKIIAYECKGHQPKNKTGLTDVQHWLSNRIPIMHPGLIEKYGPSCTIKFEYWTCGIFDDEAILELEKASREIKRYEISWKDGESIIKYSKNLSATGVRKNLAEHFFKHPTAKLDL